MKPMTRYYDLYTIPRKCGVGAKMTHLARIMLIRETAM